MSTVLPVHVVQSDAMACCMPSARVPPDHDACRDLAKRLKALSDPTRLQLLELVAATPDGRACICDLTGPLGVTQPTVSHHMKLLAEVGLVSREQRGRWVYYSLQRPALATLAQRLGALGDKRSPA